MAMLDDTPHNRSLATLLGYEWEISEGDEGQVHVSGRPQISVRKLDDSEIESKGFEDTLITLRNECLARGEDWGEPWPSS